MAESLKSKTLKGAFWTILERIGTQGIGFVVTIVLARLLTPGDYGVIGMLSVFLSISGMFIDCGFTSALIQKKDRTEEDLSTVFWSNICISVVCYIILFFAAPFIADFYKMPCLLMILRVLGVTLIINALYTVQVTRLTALVNFKIQAKISVARCVVSGVIGIALAYLGFGPWALVWQQVLSSIFSCVCFWLMTGWTPRFIFSRTSFRELFGFGSRIMAASFLHTIYTNISPIIIGRKYSAADLGFYTRADSLATLPGGIFMSTLGRVIFPILSSIQDDETRLRHAYNKYLRLMTSVVAPSMLLLAAVAKPLVVLLIGEKWLPCVPYFQLLVLGWMIDPIIVVNLNILYVKGRSDIVLRLEIIKKIIAIAIVVISVQYGVFWLCVGRVVYGYIALLLNLHYCGPFIGMSFWRQMREVLPVYIASFLAAGMAWVLAEAFNAHLPSWNAAARSFLSVAGAGLAGGILFLGLACFLKFDLIVEGREILNRAFKVRRMA